MLFVSSTSFIPLSPLNIILIPLANLLHSIPGWWVSAAPSACQCFMWIPRARHSSPCYLLQWKLSWAHALCILGSPTPVYFSLCAWPQTFLLFMYPCDSLDVEIQASILPDAVLSREKSLPTPLPLYLPYQTSCCIGYFYYVSRLDCCCCLS